MSQNERYNPSRKTIRENPFNPYTYMMPKYNPLKNNILEDTKNLCSTYNESWGAIIHNDNTVKLTQKFIFQDKKIFFSAWNRIKTFKGSSANIEELTITVGSYADLSVYLEANPIDEEE